MNPWQIIYMSKKVRRPAPKTQQTKRIDLPLNAVVYIPGQPIPDQISKLIDEKVAHNLREYERTTKTAGVAIDEQPLRTHEVVSTLLKTVKSLDRMGQNIAIAFFLDQMGKELRYRSNQAQANTREMDNHLMEARQNLENFESVLRKYN